MYEIEYSQSGDAVNTTELVDPDMNVLDLNDLEDFGKYRIRVRAYTEEGPGPYSATIEVAEEQKGMIVITTSLGQNYWPRFIACFVKIDRCIFLLQSVVYCNQ